MKKVAFVIPNNIWMCPYVSIYTHICDEKGVKYDIISWNREGRVEPGIQFNHKEKKRKQFLVFLAYTKYARFLKKTIKDNKYDKLVIFTPQVGIFLSLFLARRYKGRYIFDYRDLSLEQKAPFAKLFKRVLSNSYANVISSSGFKKYLPTGFDYLVSHNYNETIVKKALTEEAVPYQGTGINVLTIGAIRKDMNVEVMDSLGNKPGIKLSFVGKGISAEYLENYAKRNGYENITFMGYYQKKDEAEIIKQHTLINIVYPLVPSHISAMSNRFYNSLIYKRPMIVTKNTIQGDFAQQYEVGLVIDNCENLETKISDYIENLDFKQYEQRCNKLLEILLEENSCFVNTVERFIK